MGCSLLHLKSISKSFPGVRALENVSIQLEVGQIVAIVGENGAGKSTLLKILGGILTPDQGQVILDDLPRWLTSAGDAIKLDIHLIHQELNLAGNLDVAENIFLGRQPYRGPSWFPLSNRREMISRAADLLEMVGLHVSPRALVERLSVGQQQLIEIAKALSTQSRILVFDEPTSSLSLSETNRLLGLIEHLRDQGVAILYVTHRLGEVERLANRVEVLRDGRHVGTLTGNSITRPKMISLMVGRKLEKFFRKSQHQVEKGKSVLDVRRLEYEGASAPIDFHIQPGEIVGFAGLVGAGRTELARALFGIEPTSAGEIRIDDQVVDIRSPVDAVAAGMGLVPEDRQQQGLVLPLPVRNNISLTILGHLGRLGLLNRAAEIEVASQLAQKLSVHATSLEQQTLQLSGGNQQKVVLAKWLATQPKLLILDEPTRGIDVGAKSEIYKLIFQLAESGMGVMMISSEMEEIVGISDRVIVLHEGRIAGELMGDQINEEKILALAVGSADAELCPT
ncbi:MAG: sugar ABC transporter ATP-binding protein [Pirellulales bacterium]